MKTEINSSKKILKELGIKFGVRSEKKLSLAKAIIAKILYIDKRIKKWPHRDTAIYDWLLKPKNCGDILRKNLISQQIKKLSAT